MVDVWKDVEGYEGLYQVSNTESVRSLDRYVNDNGGKRFVKGQILKPKLGKNGYLSVNFCNGNGSATKIVHRLVAKTFIPNPNNYPQINHKNGIKTDNRIENLEWCTASHNNFHALRVGLRHAPKGEKHCKAKLTKKQVIEIKLKVSQGLKGVDLAIKYGVNPATISCIKTGKSWAHIK